VTAKDFFDKVVCVHGPIGVISSDRGSAFTAKLFRGLCNLLGIDQRFSSGFHPQASGQVERSNQAVISVLRAYADKKQEFWDLYLPGVVYSLNTASILGTDLTPYYLVFSNHPIHMYNMQLDLEQVDLKSMHEHLKDLVQNQIMANHIVTKVTAKLKQDMKNRYDLRARDHIYTVGDICYIWFPGVAKCKEDRRKLIQKYRGPYQIMQTRDHNLVKVKEIDNGRWIPHWVNVKRVKKALLRAGDY
jgi:hypothetical protein